MNVSSQVEMLDALVPDPVFSGASWIRSFRLSGIGRSIDFRGIVAITDEPHEAWAVTSVAPDRCYPLLC